MEKIKCQICGSGYPHPGCSCNGTGLTGEYILSEDDRKILIVALTEYMSLSESKNAFDDMQMAHEALEILK